MSQSTGKLELPGCIRTGMCCQRIPLPASPRQLRESYEEWKRWKDGQYAYTAMHMGLAHQNMKVGRTPMYGDIELIYPMLKGRCLGKIDQLALHDKLNESPEFESEDEDEFEKDDGLDRVIGAEKRVALKAKRKKHQPEWRYVYGPCKFFERIELSADGKRMLGGCSIHEIKPTMCRTYPDGDRDHRNEMQNLDRGTFRGCGYNSPGVGATLGDYSTNLVPLSAEEM